MSNEQVISSFKQLCNEVRVLEDAYAEDIEQSYEKLLNYIIEHLDFREIIANEIASIVHSFRHARSLGHTELSIDALAFCMHQLRWNEVLEIAQSEHESYFSPRYDSTLQRLINAYNDDWEEAADYERYRNKDKDTHNF